MATTDDSAGDRSPDLSRMSGEDIWRAIVETERAYRAAEDPEEKQRLFDRRAAIAVEMKSRFAWVEKLRATGYDPFAEKRTVTRRDANRLDRPKPKAPPPSPLRWQIRWQPDNPPPRAMTRDEIAQRLRRAVPEICDQLVDLALPAIGLWPQRVRADILGTASRWGGTPLAPPGWQWPTAENEPLLFVGQINCGELYGVPGAEQLPSSGVLAFFAEHDAVEASRFEAREIAIYHWTAIDNLVPVAVPIDPSFILPSCALAIRPQIDLPDPHSRAVRKLKLNEEQALLYAAEWKAVRCHGIPFDADRYSSFSKLLGWPALVQWHDLDRFKDHDDTRLLLQVDMYCNGEELHGWGPGGSLYFLLPEGALSAHNWAGCEFDIQFT
jgi:hypothetical protein